MKSTSFDERPWRAAVLGAAAGERDGSRGEDGERAPHPFADFSSQRASVVNPIMISSIQHLRADRGAPVAVEGQRAVVGERQRRDVAEHDGADLRGTTSRSG